ncbi:MAG: aminotransferase class I/II-fold pyridoxal phosphate-dependent enzyme [Cyclobacteriaceae bacterium]|nr:aminotransferase class I/II-fold pyridoxal phosphate-dependent enzyme [Cyclobacteriaceae bacterium]
MSLRAKRNVYLDANENSYGSTSENRFRRYPDPYQSALKSKISHIKGIGQEHIFIGNGSDEPIDLLIRAFCNPAKDSVIITPPTYGMYEVSATVNDVKVVKVPLKKDYSLDLKSVLYALEPGVKIVFLCSPNNPTGNSIDKDDIIKIVKKVQGLVVVDEAYIDFSLNASLIQEISTYGNLVILQTLSKAWGLAALRMGKNAFRCTGNMWIYLPV